MKYENKITFIEILNNIIKNVNYVLKIKIIKKDAFEIKNKIYLRYSRDNKFNK